MGISQQIGASSLIRPGVIDNSTQRPASPYEGQVIFQKDTDQMLVWNGTAWVIPNAPAQNPTGLEYITGGALSGTATNFAGCFTSTYDNYRVVIDGINASAGIDLYLQYLNGTTPYTGLDYQWANLGLTTGSVTTNTAVAGQNRTFTGISVTAAGQVLGAGSLDFYGPAQSGRRTFFTTNAISYESVFVARNGAGFINVTNSFDGFQLKTNTAVTVTGNVTIYGYRK